MRPILISDDVRPRPKVVHVLGVRNERYTWQFPWKTLYAGQDVTGETEEEVMSKCLKGVVL